MRWPQNRKKDFKLFATMLLLLALPVLVMSALSVQDIRNRASEEESEKQLHFITDFTKTEVTTAFQGVKYEQKIRLAGENAEMADLILGCDEDKCGDLCDQSKHNPPNSLYIAEDNRTIIWEDPQKLDGISEFPINVTAHYDFEDETSECTTQNFIIKVSEKKQNTAPKCELIFVNHSTEKIPTGRNTEFILIGEDRDNGITDAKFTMKKDNGEEESLSWEFDSVEKVVLNKDSDPPLLYKFKDTGQYLYSAEMLDSAGLKSVCATSTDRRLNIVIPGENGSPIFETDPYEQSTPSTSVLTGDDYRYDIKAKDDENDVIDYFIINENSWLNFNLNDNSAGNFEGRFSGTPTEVGSYTVAVALNDGYHDHYSTQIWVINVSSPTNDTPEVSVVLPESNSSFAQNESLKIEWSATDNNQIVKYDVYLTTDPTDESTWKPLTTGLSHNYNSYIWNTGNTPTGQYYAVVRATDNQSPEASGIGVSGKFTITQGYQQPEEPDEPGIEESYPQITNIRPSNKSTIEDDKPVISADLKASRNNTIVKNSIKLELDDKDITDQSNLEGEGKNEGSVVYKPEDPISEADHKIKVTFKDSSGKTAEKTWSFTVGIEEDEDDDDDKDVIKIFGFKIPRRVAMIFGIGITLLLLALLIPWLLIAAWRRSTDEDGYDPYTPPRIDDMPPSPVQPKSPTPPSQQTTYTQPTTSQTDQYKSSTETQTETEVQKKPKMNFTDESSMPMTARDMPPAYENDYQKETTNQTTTKTVPEYSRDTTQQETDSSQEETTAEYNSAQGFKTDGVQVESKDEELPPIPAQLQEDRTQRELQQPVAQSISRQEESNKNNVMLDKKPNVDVQNSTEVDNKGSETNQPKFTDQPDMGQSSENTNRTQNQETDVLPTSTPSSSSETTPTSVSNSQPESPSATENEPKSPSNQEPSGNTQDSGSTPSHEDAFEALQQIAEQEQKQAPPQAPPTEPQDDKPVKPVIDIDSMEDGNDKPPAGPDVLKPIG